EDSEAALLRANLVPFVAIEGDERALQNDARRLAEQWLADRKDVDPNMVGSVLRTAAAAGDRQLFDKMVAELRKNTDRQQRGYLLRALGSFRDPKLVKASLDLLLDPSLDLRESLNPLLLTPRDEAETERLPFDFLKANYDSLLGRL